MTGPITPWPPQPPANQAPPAPAPQMVRIQAPQMRPLATYGIIALTIAVFLLQELSNSGILSPYFLEINRLVFGSQDLQTLLNRGYGSDLLVLLGGMNIIFIKMGQVWRFLTPALLHFGLVHIGANMYSLYVLGPSLERFYGHNRFIGLYVLCAFGGNLLSFLMGKPQNISAGASTAIFGLIAAEGIFIFRNRSLFGNRARSMLNNVIFLIILNLVIGVSFGFDNWGHLGGLLTGAIFSWFAGPNLEVEQNPSGYMLVDQRPATMVWLIWIVMAILMAGLGYVGILRP